MSDAWDFEQERLLQAAPAPVACLDRAKRGSVGTGSPQARLAASALLRLRALQLSTSQGPCAKA